MVAKNPGRYLAPVAIIAVAVAVGLLVRDGLNNHHTVTSPPAQQQAQHQATTARHGTPKKRFYVIKPGDTLSSISVKTKVPIATLESLNPSLQDPNALQTGTRIRLH
jgi:LysM repeat protein